MIFPGTRGCRQAVNLLQVPHRMQVPILIDEKTKDKIQDLVHLTGKPEEKVVHEVIETGLKNYKQAHRSAAKALLEIADYAKKIGPKDLIVNHDTSQWDERASIYR